MFGRPLSRPAADALHPAIGALSACLPTRKQVLQAAFLIGEPPPEPEDVIFRNGYDLFCRLCPALPANYWERGAMLEELFRPILENAQDKSSVLPDSAHGITASTAPAMIQAYHAIHWALGARAAAMALYSAPP